jgi:hypothetical protein
VELDPLGRDLAAFDLAVIAPSHTLVHDAIAARLPFATAPVRAHGRLHEPRGHTLAELRLAPSLAGLDDDAATAALRDLADGAARARTAERLGGIEAPDGARQVAELLVDMVRGTADAPIAPVEVPA